MKVGDCARRSRRIEQEDIYELWAIKELSEEMVSHINASMMQMVANQRQQDLWAAAAEDRRASLARQNRPVWWRQLVRRRRRPAPTGVDPAPISIRIARVAPVPADPLDVEGDTARVDRASARTA